jgi:hypothetical protein
MGSGLMRTPDDFREDYDPPPDDEREDARADAKREAQEDARGHIPRARGLHCQSCGSTIPLANVISGCPDCGAYSGKLEGEEGWWPKWAKAAGIPPQSEDDSEPLF